MTIPKEYIYTDSNVGTKYYITSQANLASEAASQQDDFLFIEPTHTIYLNYLAEHLNFRIPSSRIELETFFINDFINPNYLLKKPIEVNIIRDGIDFIGEIPSLDIYSFGYSETEVLRELNLDITELFDELIALNDSQLGKKPKKWKKILSEYIGCSDANS